MGDHLLGAQGDRHRFLGGQGEGLVEGVRVQRLRAAQHAGQRLERGAHDVVVRLLSGQAHAGGLGVEAAHPAPRVLRAEALLHHPRPDPAGGTELGDLLEKIAVRVKEKTEPGRKAIDRQSALERPIDVLDTVAQRERKFLNGGRAGLANMIAADRNRIEARRVAGRELDGVGHQAHGRAGRENVLLLRDVFLEDVVLDGARKPRPVDALLLRHREIHGPEHGRRRVDGHGGGDIGQRNAAEQHLHIGE